MFGRRVYRYHTPESQHLAEHARREARLLADALHSDELTEADEWERALPQIKKEIAARQKKTLNPLSRINFNF